MNLFMLLEGRLMLEAVLITAILLSSPGKRDERSTKLETDGKNEGGPMYASCNKSKEGEVQKRTQK